MVYIYIVELPAFNSGQISQENPEFGERRLRRGVELPQATSTWRDEGKLQRKYAALDINHRAIRLAWLNCGNRSLGFGGNPFLLEHDTLQT